MKIATIIGIFALAGATALGCSGASTTGSGFDNSPGGDDSLGGSSDDGGSSGASSGSSGNSSGSTTSSGGGASGGSSSGASKPPVTIGGDGGVTTTIGGDGGAAQDNDETDYTETKTLKMDPFPVPANTEVFYCQTFVNPWGKQADIKTYDLTMDTGSHHMFAFYVQNPTATSVASCPSGGLQFGPFTFTSQAPKVTETYPATVGATIPATTGFQLMAHYVNTTAAPLTAHVTLTMYAAKPGLVTNHVGVIFDNQATMMVPPSKVTAANPTPAPYASTQTLAVGQEVYILSASSHMHKFGTQFTATANVPGGSPVTIYQTTDWDEPVAKVYNPPLHLPNGTSITWTCMDVNPSTTQALTFGEYANTNVMCINVDIFYPVSNINNPTIGSAIGGF
jgi:hypothetical protein